MVQMIIINSGKRLVSETLVSSGSDRYRILEYSDGSKERVELLPGDTGFSSTTLGKPKDTVWAEDAKAYIPKSKAITLRGGKHYTLHTGKGRLSFFIEERMGFFYAHIFNKKLKEIVSSFVFGTKQPTPDEVRAVIFENTVHIARAASMIGTEPFVVGFTHRITNEVNWKQKYNSNIGISSPSKDRQLESHHAMLDGLAPEFVRGTSVADALAKAREQIKLNRETLIEVAGIEGEMPLYDVYAIWTNYTENPGLISSTNDFVRRSPNFFSSTVFRSIEDIRKALL